MREILRLVWADERSAGDIARTFDVSWPAISQNLRVLKESGLVRERRVGTSRMYRADRGIKRQGIAAYALSALDIALWDIAGKAAGLPLANAACVAGSHEPW